MRILIVDDNPTFLIQMKKFLATKGFEVDIADGGRKALEMLYGNKYDVAILDLKMPDMHGIEVMRKARKRSIKTAFIVVTGYGEVESAVEAMKLGAIDYIQKPFDAEKIVKVIKRIGKKQSFLDFIKENIEGEIMLITFEEPSKFEKKYGIKADDKIWLKEIDIEDIIKRIAESEATIIHSGIGYLIEKYGREKVKDYLEKLNEIAEDKKLRIFIPCKNMQEKDIIDEIYGSEKTIEEMIEICKNPIRRKVLQLLEMHGKLSYSQIMKMLGIDYSSKFAFHLKKLLSMNIVEKKGDGYVLTEYGRYMAEILMLLQRKRLAWFIL